MRLIDEETIDFDPYIDPFEIPGAQCAVSQAPTVDAIPVEWIREWQTHHSSLVVGFTAYLLLDWEKENGTENN